MLRGVESKVAWWLEGFCLQDFGSLHDDVELRTVDGFMVREAQRQAFTPTHWRLATVGLQFRHKKNRRNAGKRPEQALNYEKA